jgi:hypothetical protein
MDLLAAVGELCSPDHFSRRIICHRQATGLAAGVDLEAERLHDGIWTGYSQNQRKRVATPDGCLLLLEQESRTSRRAGHQWTLLRVEYQDA